MHGAAPEPGQDLAKAVADADLVVTTYGVAVRDASDLGCSTWARVVCDEAQHIKSSRTKQAEAVRAIPAASRIALTGTPVENHLGELWSILDFADPGLLGSRERFERSVADLHRDPERRSVRTGGWTASYVGWMTVAGLSDPEAAPHLQAWVVHAPTGGRRPGTVVIPGGRRCSACTGAWSGPNRWIGLLPPRPSSHPTTCITRMHCSAPGDPMLAAGQ